MSIQEVVFSPTGGTQKTADIVAEQLSTRFGKKKMVDLTDSGVDFSGVSFSGNDIVLLAVPSYGGRVPAVCAERIQKLHGNSARAVLICAYGNRAYDDTLLELSELAEKAGFSVQAAVSAVAEHSIVRKCGAGRPDTKDEKELIAFVSQIGEKLSAPSSEKLPAIPGSHPYKKASAGGMVPRAGKACMKCGLCAEKCPVQAIDKNNLQAADAKKCISCMRCVAVCPARARKLNPAMQLAV